MPLPQIAFTPPAGWSPFTGVTQEQRSADVRIANPGLLGSVGMITCIVFPADGLSLPDRVDQFLTRLPDRLVERVARTSATGIKVLFVHQVGNVPGKSTEKHSMHCFFLNGAGHVIDLYCVGTTEVDARVTTDAFLKTLRLVSADA